MICHNPLKPKDRPKQGTCSTVVKINNVTFFTIKTAIAAFIERK